MREDVIYELEREVVRRGFSEAVACRVAGRARYEYEALRYRQVADLAAWFEYQELRYRQVADLSERRDKTPVDVYVGVLSGRLPWVWHGFTIDEAAFGSLLPHISAIINTTSAWRIEKDSDALLVTLSNTPYYFDMVILSPTVDEDGIPRVRLTANKEWCGSWRIPTTLYQFVRDEIMLTIGRAAVWRKPLPQAEDVERLLEALSDEAAKKLEEEERGGAG